ncbi:hypothetical protein [Streptomyces mirabilis]|uniref:hypothetical protein n=1 Tax=Streptomyces mirabilis TaxID=68239 RepID=UPI0036D7AC77
MLSGLVVVEADAPHLRAHVPTLCLVAASLEVPGVAARVGALPGLEFLPLDFAGTSTPEAYDRTGVWAVDIGKS